MHLYTNSLAQESSPYLLQHAHNPVNWYPWGPAAFEKAKQEQKPVLVSIGYAACHWCHVMERESFEDEAVAAIMNEHFVNIKVDREERPDLDHIYMDAVQALTGSGGWPLNVFLTPEKKPFYGGTYFPPQRAFNRASWTEVLTAVSEAYQNNKANIEQQAAQLTTHLQNTYAAPLAGKEAPAIGRQQLAAALEQIMQLADTEWGGFGKEPKFPQTFTLNFLLAYGAQHQHAPGLEQAFLSLDKMAQGGIYDQVGGGFARYATDREWLVPHFEKMLYDNALLVNSFAQAYQLTKKDAYRQVIEETLAFAERELQHPEGGFYSALDADSEGEEGKFYVWTYNEVQAILGADAPLFCEFFNITPAGNWEGKNILWIPVPLQNLAEKKGIAAAALKQVIEAGKKQLLQARSKRVRPLLDDKILLSWNALMNQAYSYAFAATGNLQYRAMAEKNMAFLLKAFAVAEGLCHTWKNGQPRHPAFLDDYASLIAALISLGQVTANTDYWQKAAVFAATALKIFGDEGSPLLFFTAAGQTDVLLRKKEVYDGATPSGNALMAQNLLALSIIFDNAAWRSWAQEMILAYAGAAVAYPASFGVWLHNLWQSATGTTEIAIVGPNYQELLQSTLEIFLPGAVIMASETADDRFPLLKARGQHRKNCIYLCQNYACLQPVATVAELEKLLQANKLADIQ